MHHCALGHWCRGPRRRGEAGHQFGRCAEAHAADSEVRRVSQSGERHSLDSLFERLGIAAAITPKAIRPETDVVSELVAKGEAEIGMVVITQILTTRGVELVGPLPPEIQSYVTFTAAVSARSAAPAAARRLIEYLTGPTAVRVIRSQGMEPE